MERPDSTGGGARRSFAAAMDEVSTRLASMEVSCLGVLGGGDSGAADTAPEAHGEPAILTPRRSQLELLQLQTAQLRAQLTAAVARREVEDAAFKAAADFAAAKGGANAALHALFGLVKNGKTSELARCLESGVVPARDGFFQHWRLDPRLLRDETGATLLHAAVDVSMKPEKVKLKLLPLLLDVAGFDPNTRDLFGRTALHTAAMSGYAEMAKVLLASGCDPLAVDRSGLTALSLVRTKSRPKEEVVQVLAAAESAAFRDATPASSAVAPQKAIASALFLRGVTRFILPQRQSEFSKQSAALLSALLRAKNEHVVSLDQFVREFVPVLFDSSPASGTVRLKGLFTSATYRDAGFIEELTVEADAYGVSLVAPLPVNSALLSSSWLAVLLKMIRFVKLEVSTMETPREMQAIARATTPPSPSTSQPAASQALSDLTSASSIDSEASTQQLSYYAEHSLDQTRQAWHYAVLFKAVMHVLPGTLSLKDESAVAVATEDLSKLFPLDGRLSIGSDEYWVVSYSPEIRELKLDHAYKGQDVAGLKAYVSSASSAALPPYIAMRRIWQRTPGNKYEEHTSSEQELFQDCQFMDPESEYEVAIKLGPLSAASDAKKLADEWKKRTKQHFQARTCVSGQAACVFQCPQRDGHSLCLGSMTAVARDLAKKQLGWPTLAKLMKPRAAVQKLESRFKGTDAWPGSPSHAEP